MNQKHLLKYIKHTLEKEGDLKVCVKDGKEMTLNEVFKSLNMNAYDLTVDSLDCHADKNIYHRFDNFNAKYNPMGVGLLREIYIKTNNFINGRYFAEIIKQVMKDLEDQKYVMAELRLSVYGAKYNEFEVNLFSLKFSTWQILLGPSQMGSRATSLLTQCPLAHSNPTYLWYFQKEWRRTEFWGLFEQHFLANYGSIN